MSNILINHVMNHVLINVLNVNYIVNHVLINTLDVNHVSIQSLTAALLQSVLKSCTVLEKN